MKYYAYYDPSPKGDIQTVLSVKEIVRERVCKAERNHACYCTAHNALLDHIVVNWAYRCDKNGAVIKGKELWPYFKV